MAAVLDGGLGRQLAADAAFAAGLAASASEALLRRPDYRLTQTVIWAVNLASGAALWPLGVQFVQGRTGWDYVIYFCPFLLNGLAAIVCFRLAAPPVLSGKGAFFKRL